MMLQEALTIAAEFKTTYPLIDIDYEELLVYCDIDEDLYCDGCPFGCRDHDSDHISCISRDVFDTLTRHGVTDDSLLLEASNDFPEVYL